MSSRPTSSKLSFTVMEQAGGYTLCANEKPMQTPGKKPFLLPTKPLAEAICKEWQANTSFSSSRMPLTSIAYTAIDRVSGQEGAIIEALLVYVDTDTLSYRDSGSNPLLAQRQKEQWDPVLAWADKLLGVPFAVTQGIMPVDQSSELQAAFRKNIEKLDVMRLSALSVLASCCSSMLLALAVVRGHIGGEEAFLLSRLEEETQAEAWGRDPEATQRAERLKDEIVAATLFLRLLESL